MPTDVGVVKLTWRPDCIAQCDALQRRRWPPSALAAAARARGGLTMRWPWSSRERRAANYTDLLIAGAESWAATGSSPSATTAAVEAAAGCWARTFGSAAVENAPDDVIEVLAPLTLAQIGRDLIRRGECVLAISLGGDGELMLAPASAWEVSGATADPSTWVYRVEDQGPSGRRTRTLPASSVIHAVYSYDPSRPWQGRGPLSWASLSATLHDRAERALAQDVSGAVGYVLPAPAGGENADDDDASDAQLGALLSRLKALKGGLMVVEQYVRVVGRRCARPAPTGLGATPAWPRAPCHVGRCA